MLIDWLDLHAMIDSEDADRWYEEVFEEERIRPDRKEYIRSMKHKNVRKPSVDGMN